MARYIDADNLIEHLKDEIKGCEIPPMSRANGKGIAYGTALGLKSAISFAETLSTADVAPKSEVEKLQNELVIWKQNRFNIYQKLECYETARQKVAREIFEAIEREVSSKIPMKFTPIFKRDLDYDAGVIDGKHDAFFEVLVLIAELKKKYTEGKE